MEGLSLPRLYLLDAGVTTYNGVNPITYEPSVSHSLLDIHSSHMSLKTEITQWLIEYYHITADQNDQRYGFDRETGEYYIDFDTEQDLMWFKLRWLS